MQNKGMVTVSFEMSDWLLKQIDLLADYKTAEYPEEGRVTRDDVLHTLVFDGMMAKMDRTGGRLKLRRPPSASARGR